MAAANIIPIRQTPLAPASYTLPRHASTSHLEQKQLSSPKNKRRFSFMPSRKEPSSNSFMKSPLRRSLREMSLRKKQQSGSLPDFTSFNMGKNKNSNCNQSKTTTDGKSTLGSGVVTRIPPPNQHQLSNLNSNNSNNSDVMICTNNEENITEEDGDLVHTTSEITFPSTANEEITPRVRNRSSSDSVNLKLTVPQIGQEKPALRDSDEYLDQKQLPTLIAKGLCFGSYAFHKK